MGANATLVPAVYLILLRDGQILMLRRFQTGFEDGNYSVPAGHLHPGEAVIAGAIREAREETGIDLEPADLTVVGVLHRRAAEVEQDRVDFFLTARAWRGEPQNCEPEKCDHLAWFPLDGLPANTIPYIRQALENLKRGVWFGSAGWEDPS